MTTDKEQQEFNEQEELAKRIFFWRCVWLVVFILGLIIFQFKLWGLDKEADWVKYLTWLFAALVGSSAYLIWNVGFWYQRIRASDKNKRADFKKYKLWYTSTLLRAPVLAVVLLWILTNLKIDLGGTQAGNGGVDVGVTINFHELPEIVLLGVAFILGYYGRVAQEQLNIITKAIFPRAYAIANTEFAILAPKVLLLKEKYSFKVEPITDVVWTTDVGTVDADSGAYIAPDDLAKVDQKATIRAALRSEPSVSQCESVLLKLFKISGKTNLKSAESDVIFTLETRVDDVKLEEAIWDCEAGTLSVTKGKEVKFTAPLLNANETEKQVKISAKLKHGEKDYEASEVITVK
jgi:hypothetical protein